MVTLPSNFASVVSLGAAILSDYQSIPGRGTDDGAKARVRHPRTRGLEGVSKVRLTVFPVGCAGTGLFVGFMQPAIKLDFY